MIDIATVQNQSPPNAIKSGKLAGSTILPVDVETSFSEVIQKEISTTQGRINSQKTSETVSNWQSKNQRTSTQEYQKSDNFDAARKNTSRESDNRSSKVAATLTKNEAVEAHSSIQKADQNSQETNDDPSKVNSQDATTAEGSVLKNNGKHSHRKLASSTANEEAVSEEKKDESVEGIACNPTVLSVVQPEEVELSQPDSVQGIETVTGGSGETATAQANSAQEILFSQLLNGSLADGSAKAADSGDGKAAVSAATESSGLEAAPTTSVNVQMEQQSQVQPQTSQSTNVEMAANVATATTAQSTSTDKAEKVIASTVKNDKADNATIDLAAVNANTPQMEQNSVKITAVQSAVLDGGNSGLQNKSESNGTASLTENVTGSKGQQAETQKISGGSDVDLNGVNVFSTSGQTSSVSANSSVKTTDTSATPIQQIVQETAASLKAGKSTVHLQLNPQDLGTIDIRLTSDSKGLGITIMTEHASTGRMLESQIENLRQSLSDAGLNLSNLNFSMKDGSGQMGQNQAQTNQENRSNNYSNLFQRSWNSDADAEKSATPSRLSLLQSSIDYLA